LDQQASGRVRLEPAAGTGAAYGRGEGMAQFDSDNPDEAAVVAGNSAKGPAVWAQTTDSRAVVGIGLGDACGLWGQVNHGRAVVGAVDGGGGTGVWGEATNGAGVVGKDNGGGDGVTGEGRRGVVGRSTTYQGVYGWSRDNAGVVGESAAFHAVFGISGGLNNAGVFGGNTGGGWAGIFDGRVSVTGNLYVGGDVRPLGADVAEEFEVEDGADVRPGCVVRLGDSGGLRPVERPYDTSVLGIVSGAAGYRPGLVLDTGQGHRLPIALVGKVMCWVDADLAAVGRGDLLTTSPTPGHAMRARASRATGSLVGKALDALPSGRGLLPVLVALR
jgi:hypothetical protein